MLIASVLCVLGTAAQCATSDLDAAVRSAITGESYNVVRIAHAPSGTADDGWTATHPHLDMRARFTAGALVVEPTTSQAWSWSTRLVAFGRLGSVQALENAEFAVDRDVVEGARAGVIERFLHFRGGLEQSFSIRSRPAGDASAPLVVKLECDTDLMGCVDRDGRAATFRDACGATVLTYQGLTAFDSTGHELAAHMQFDGDALVLTIDDRDAEYPIDIDPVIATSETKLLPSTTAAISLTGTRVKVDGDIAAVQVQHGPSGIFLFERTTSGWVERQFIASSPGAKFALDDPWLLIGDGYWGYTGQAWLWEHVGASWVYRNDLSDPNPNYSCEPQTYGASVALDGDRAVIGETEHWCPWYGGAVHIAEWVPQIGMWRFRQRIFGPFQFGGTVALSGDDLLAGGKHFRYDAAAGEFVLQGTLPISGPVPEIEDGIALSSTGSQGWQVLELFGSTWRITATLPSDSTVGPIHPGGFAALAGSLIAIGDPNSDLLGAETGAVQIWGRNGGWTRMATLQASDVTAGDWFGYSVDIASGSTPLESRVIAGAPYKDGIGMNSGAAYVFELEQQDALVYCTSKVNSQNCIPRIGFSGSASVSSATPFTISGTQVINQRSGIFFYGTSGRALVAFQGGLRCVHNPTVRSYYLLSGGNATGTDCSGVLAFDFNAWMQSGIDPALVAGALVDGQFWYRDGASSFGTGLTEAIEFVVGP